MVELVLERGVALGERAVIEALGLNQYFLLLARDLLQLVALALHFALHAAHARGHLRALRVLHRRDHLRHLIEQLARELARAFDVALSQFFADLIQGALNISSKPSPCIVSAFMKSSGICCASCDIGALQRIEGLGQLGDLLHDRVEILVAALELLQRVHQALLAARQILRRRSQLLSFHALADVFG